MPLAWDNVVHGSRGLGYVVATHQWVRQPRPAQTAFTAYCPLDAEANVPGGNTPETVRRWLANADPAALMDIAVTDLRAVYGRVLFAHADLSGLSVFEEAAWWGTRAARRIVG